MELDQIPSNQTWVPKVTSDFAENLLGEEGLRRNFDLIDADIEHLKSIFSARVLSSVNVPESSNQILVFPEWPTLGENSGPYAALGAELPYAERLLLLLCILPHYAPEILQQLIAPIQKGVIVGHSLLGGHINHTTLQYIPSLQSVLFLAAGQDKTAQHICYRSLVINGSLMKRQIVTLNPPTLTETNQIGQRACAGTCRRICSVHFTRTSSSS